MDNIDFYEAIEANEIISKHEFFEDINEWDRFCDDMES